MHQPNAIRTSTKQIATPHSTTSQSQALMRKYVHKHVYGWTIPFLTPCTISKRLTFIGCSPGLPWTTVNILPTKQFCYMVIYLSYVLVILRQAFLRVPHNLESEHFNLRYVIDFQSGVLATRLSVTGPNRMRICLGAVQHGSLMLAVQFLYSSLMLNLLRRGMILSWCAYQLSSLEGCESY